MRRFKNKFSKTRGIGLIEALLSLLVISFLILIFSNITNFIQVATFSKNTIHAYQLAQEEIENLRNIDFDKLTNRTNADFLNVAYNKGEWQVINDGTSNVYELISPGTVSGVTGIALLPIGDLDNFTLEIDIKALNDSPAGWQAGFYFRYQDEKNFYRLSYTETGLEISKSVEGAETSLFSSTGYPTNSWATYRLVANSNNFEIYRNGSPLESGSFTDAGNSFTKGKIALLGENSVHAYFDEVKIDGSLVTNGNFESGVLQRLADGWQRLGINDLPSGSDKLTIQDYGGNSDLKEITVRVEWQERGQTKNLELQSIISRYGIHLK